MDVSSVRADFGRYVRCGSDGSKGGLLTLLCPLLAAPPDLLLVIALTNNGVLLAVHA